LILNQSTVTDYQENRFGGESEFHVFLFSTKKLLFATKWFFPKTCFQKTFSRQELKFQPRSPQFGNQRHISFGQRLLFQKYRQSYYFMEAETHFQGETTTDFGNTDQSRVELIVKEVILPHHN
jgi:hypothetical protein